MDSLKDWTSVLEWFKRPFFAFVATVILGTLLLSSEILDWLGFGSFRWIVAILFLLSLGILLSQVLAASKSSLCLWKRNKSIVANCRKRLNQLTHDEKFILKRYIDGKTRTQYFDINDGVVIGLERAGLISRMSTTSVGWLKFPYNITDVAWDYLNKHPGVLTDR